MFRLISKYKKSFVLGALLIAAVLTLGTNTVKIPTFPFTSGQLPGYSNVAKWTGSTLASTAVADTSFLNFSNPITGNERDSILLVVHSYSSATGRSSMSVRFQQSMNNVTWKSTTLGTDSTTYIQVGGTNPTTLATAVINEFQIGNFRYNTYPYNRILVITPFTLNTIFQKWECYVSVVKTGL